MHCKPICITFDKLDGYIGKYDGTKYLVLFHSNEKYERISKLLHEFLLELDILLC